MAKRYGKEIANINGIDSFVKVKNNSFEIERVIFAFVKYDTSTNKAIKFGDYYMDFGDALILVREITSGILMKNIYQEAERAKAAGERYAKKVRQFQGGTVREGEKTVARIFSIVPGTANPNYPVVFQYEEGEGEKDLESGLIKPLWWKRGSGVKADVQIHVPMSANDLIKLALLLQMHMQGFISSCYGNDSYKVDYSGNVAESESSFTGKHSSGTARTQSNSTKNSVQRTDNVQKNSASPEKPATAAVSTNASKPYDVVCKFASCFMRIEGNPNLLYADIAKDGKTCTIWFQNSVLKASGREQEFLKAMKNNVDVKLQLQNHVEGGNKYAYFVA